MEITWDNIDEVYLDVSREELDEFYENSVPDDFYFAAIEFDGEVIVGIVAKDYFDRNGHAFDQEIAIDHILPEHFWQSMESIWSSDHDLEEVVAELKELGFTENSKFKKDIESLVC